MVKIFSILLSAIVVGFIGIPRGLIGASIGVWERYVEAIKKLLFTAKRYPEQNGLNYELLFLKYSSTTTYRSSFSSSSTFLRYKLLFMCWNLFFLTFSYVLIWIYQLFIGVSIGPYDTYILSYNYFIKKFNVR